MSHFIERFKRQTYSRHFLWQMVGFFALLTIGGAYLVEAAHVRRDPVGIEQYNIPLREQIYAEDFHPLWETVDTPEGDDAQKQLLELLTTSKPYLLCDLIAFAAEHPKQSWYKLFGKVLGHDKPVAEEIKLYHALWLSLVNTDGELGTELAGMLSEQKVPRYVYYAAGVFWMNRTQIDKAIDQFEQEAVRHPSTSARWHVIWVCQRYNRWYTLDRLIHEHNDFAMLLEPYEKLQIMAHTGQWWDLFRKVPHSQWGDLDLLLICTSLGIGSFWFLFLLKATQPVNCWKQRTGLCLLATFLGVLSIWLTVFMIYVQEDGWGLVEGSDAASIIFYYVAGVGFREELCKLLLVLPLVPIIAKPNNGLRMLLIPACVGLGFAIEENMQYYDMSMMADITGRFVSANVFHFMLTGMAGMELCWFWLYPKQRWQNFLGTFALVVLLHGGYDAIITLTEGDSILGMGSIAILILITYQFFRLLREYRKPQQSGVSQVFVYVMGVCVSAMVVVYYQTWVMGLSAAFNTLADELLFMGIMSVLFLREIPTVLTD